MGTLVWLYKSFALQVLGFQFNIKLLRNHHHENDGCFMGNILWILIDSLDWLMTWVTSTRCRALPTITARQMQLLQLSNVGIHTIIISSFSFCAYCWAPIPQNLHKYFTSPRKFNMLSEWQLFSHMDHHHLWNIILIPCVVCLFRHAVLFYAWNALP